MKNYRPPLTPELVFTRGPAPRKEYTMTSPNGSRPHIAELEAKVARLQQALHTAACRFYEVADWDFVEKVTIYGDYPDERLKLWARAAGNAAEGTCDDKPDTA